MQVKIVYEPSFRCLHCERAFTAEETLEHITTCTPRVVCTSCRQTFADVHALMAHYDAAGHGRTVVQLPAQSDAPVASSSAQDSIEQSKAECPTSPLSEGSEGVLVELGSESDFSDLGLSDIDSFSDARTSASAPVPAQVVAGQTGPAPPSSGRPQSEEETCDIVDNRPAPMNRREAPMESANGEATTTAATSQKMLAGTCMICNRELATDKDFKAHCQHGLATHPQCSTCDTLFLTDATLKDHVEKVGCEAVLCGDCGVSFSSFHDLTKHREKNHGVVEGTADAGQGPNIKRTSSHVAAEPSTGAGQTSSSTTHLPAGMSQPISAGSCMVCSRVFSASSSFKLHCELNVDTHPFCRQCERLFQSDSLLHEHHVQTGCHCRCGDCGKFVPSGLGMEIHQREEKRKANSAGPTSQKMGAGTCIVCDLAFQNKAEFKAHCQSALAMHPYCSICQIVFSTNVVLSKHFEETGCQLTVCVTCKASFKHADGLKCHQMSKKHGRFEMKQAVGQAPASSSLTPAPVLASAASSSSSPSQNSQPRNNAQCSSQSLSAGSCIICSQNFSDDSSFRMHCRLNEESHPFCVECKVLFLTDARLKDHYVRSGCHSRCADCDTFFAVPHAIKSHQMNKKHGSYSTKPLFMKSQVASSFVGTSASNSKLPSSRPVSYNPAYCAECKEWFPHEAGLTIHITSDKRHAIYSPASRVRVKMAVPIKKPEPPCCTVCKRSFSNEEALRQHERSKKHKNNVKLASTQGTSTQKPSAATTAQHEASTDRLSKCPLCPKMFGLPSAIAHHIESGCHGINRHQVTAAVHNMGIVPTISLTHRITSGDPYSAKPLVNYSATERAWNGAAYECYLCHRPFAKLTALNTHLASAAHDEKEFVCTNGKCKRQFTLISALVQHIESGSCGVARFAEVKKYADALEAQFSRMLTL